MIEHPLRRLRHEFRFAVSPLVVKLCIESEVERAKGAARRCDTAAQDERRVGSIGTLGAGIFCRRSDNR